MKQIIFDTDIGDDIDDALALAFALNLKQLDIRAITTVHAETEIRSQIAAMLLETAHRPEIPVATGLSRPFRRPPRTGTIQAQAKILDEKMRIVRTAAPTFIYETLEENGGPFTILCIGPLTNIAQLLLDHPNAGQYIEEIVIMGGLFNRTGIEYNIEIDPDAAKVVFDAGIPMHIIPLEITEQCPMVPFLVEETLKDPRPVQRLLAKLIRYWQAETNLSLPVLHDPLAVAYLVYPELFVFERMDIEVRLEISGLYGQTVGKPNSKSLLQVCTGVDYTRFHEMFSTCILGEFRGRQEHVERMQQTTEEVK